jgi:hypothetical protein
MLESTGPLFVASRDTIGSDSESAGAVLQPETEKMSTRDTSVCKLRILIPLDLTQSVIRVLASDAAAATTQPLLSPGR